MPRTPRKLKACCGEAYLEPLYFVAGGAGRHHKTRFGAVAVCARCRRPVGAVELDRLVEAGRAFDAASWALMEKTHPFPPYNFVPGLGGALVPEEGYLPAAAPTQLNPTHDEETPHDD